MAIFYPSLLFVGPPGAGKGTQGKFLDRVTPHYHLSSGEVLRNIDPASAYGELIHSCTREGRLVPDEITLAIAREHITSLIDEGTYDPHRQLLILDGLPRNLRQAQEMDSFVDCKGIILFEIEGKDTLIDRLTIRADHEWRDDDRREVIDHRLKLYHEDTLPLVAHYSHTPLHRINASQPPYDVLKDLLLSLSPTLQEFPPT
ncbi:MAG: nucleoside monophosphate kinase [Chlamydiota bacterium]|nr:nucleoside monophosphate kinase [Chlamydiota bacterium]